MATVSECNIPEDRYYWIDKHVWARRLAGDEIEVGITDPAQALAGKILVCRIKKVGRELKRGASAATLESGKWVGGVSTPVAGVISQINENAENDPESLNRDPYGTWLFRLHASSPDEDLALLVTGADAVSLYQQKILQDGISCHHS
ncbi:MAG: glycine cleavage system protein H [Sulfobacillus thermosulfidooxidans]|uniref:Glycine cleavage system protein H n=1 Tax=Sulfobacillus thermosulfidooxidans TaxID=28034 RepID=A0A2T2X2N0_SULTH|nr:MAG: glycine cleavage system protein H [Sulfobacillus thermosulfidooxidans]